MSNKKILIADDDDAVSLSLQFLLEEESYQTVVAKNVEEVKFYVKKEDFDLVLLDMNYDLDTTSGQEGLLLIEHIHEHNPHTPIVAMTGWSSVELSVKTIKKGASDFIEKPWSNERLLSIVRNQIALGDSKRKSEKLEITNQLLTQDTQNDYVGEDANMLELMNMLEQVAHSDIGVILYGENGTGKSYLAKKVHEMSDRVSGPFISVNMGAIPENLFESEMFGHAKGAFTDAKSERIGRFELAEGGTLFLDEIANIPLSQQAKLLRVLESNEYEKVGSNKTQLANVRIVSATNADLNSLCEQGLFRTDLMYRLTGIDVTVPALKERPKDIIALANFQIEKMRRKYNKHTVFLGEAAKTVMVQYEWPGNVRELLHTIERAVLLTGNKGGTDEIQPRTLNIEQKSAMTRDDMVTDLGQSDLLLEEIEHKIILQRLKRFSGNANETAESLGLSRSAFYRRMDKFKIKEAL